MDLSKYASSGKYLKKDDLNGPRQVTIKTVSVENVALPGTAPSTKPIVHFHEEDIKPLVSNTTNTRFLIGFLGSDSERWPGNQIELFVDPAVVMNGVVVGGIRVRSPQPSGHATTQLMTAADSNPTYSEHATLPSQPSQRQPIQHPAPSPQQQQPPWEQQ